MNPNFFNPTGFFDSTNSNFLNNIFNTTSNSLNSNYSFMSSQPQNSYHMEEEPNIYGSRSYHNTNTNIRNENSFNNGGFFRNFESFPEIFHPDNFFSSRPRHSRQSRRQRENIPEHYENSDEQDNTRNTNLYQEKVLNMQELKIKQAKELKKRDILEAEKNPKSGHYWKNVGNEAFKKGALDQAIQFYIKAIVILSNMQL